MKTVFLNIGYMQYYRGINKNDVEINGNEDAFDQFNFCMANIDEEEIVIGYCDYGNTKVGVPTSKLGSDTDYAENILAVWCAKNADGNLVVVGWYNNATVYKNYCSCTFESDDAVCGYEQLFNVEAYASDCVLLPEKERQNCKWHILDTDINNFEKYNNVWLGSIESIENEIKKYNGDNLMLHNI